MPFPASVTTVDVHIALLNGLGEPVAGKVTWTIPQIIRDTTGNIVIVPGSHPVELDAAGEATITMPATDDPELAPQGWAYNVVISGTGLRSEAMRIQLPVALAPGPVEFADLATVEDAPDVLTYLPIGGGTLTGALTLSGAPTQALHAATKAYVDSGGGSGISPAILDAKGDLIAASAPDTPDRLAVGTDGQVLRAASGQVTGLQWDTLDAADVAAAAAVHTHAAGDVVSGTLAVARGGTGIAAYTTGNYVRASGATALEQRTPAQVTFDIGAIAHSLADAKGDILAAANGDAFLPVPVGSNGQVLTADSAEVTGVKWATPAGGGGGSTLVVRKQRIIGGDTALDLGSGAWNLLTIANGADNDFLLPIPAAVGDYVELGILMMSQSGNAFLDLAVVVSGVAARYASTDTNTPAVEGLPALYNQPADFLTALTPWGFEVEAGDLSGGNVTFGIAAKGTTGTLFSSTSYPFLWIAKNHGPVDFA